MNSKTSMHSNIQHLNAFLDKIAADHDTEMEETNAQLQQELASIRREAYRSAKEFHQAHASRTRQQAQLNHDRYLAQARTKIRRQQWQALEELKERIVANMVERMDQAWRDPSQQQAWCRYWLQQARGEATEMALSIRLGEGGLEQTQQALQQSLVDHPVACQVALDSSLPPGLTIEWGDMLLDATLAAQLPRIQELVLQELNDWQHRSNLKEQNSDEPS